MALANGIVYVDSKNGNIYALDQSTGNQLWSTKIGPQGANNVASPAVSSGGVVYIGSRNSNIYALNASTGAIVWKKNTGPMHSSPVVANGRDYMGYSPYFSGRRTFSSFCTMISGLSNSRDGNGTQFYLSDAQGSLVSSFNNSQGGASMKSNQLFGPYGNARYVATTVMHCTQSVSVDMDGRVAASPTRGPLTVMLPLVGEAKVSEL